MREIYVQQTKDTPFPYSFGRSMEAYKFLMSSTMIEELFLGGGENCVGGKAQTAKKKKNMEQAPPKN